MRFAHLADTHLGYRQYNMDEREDDFYRAFNECIDKIIGEGCDMVIHSGDLFDEPRPHVRALVEVRRALERLGDEDIPFICIAGNHDILLRKGAMPPHRIYKGLKLLTPGKPFEVIDDVFIGGVPYHSRVYTTALKARISDLEEEAARYDNRILALHQGVYELFSLEHEIKLPEIPATFDYYALGHVHRRMSLPHGRGHAVYPGSIEIWRIDEMKDYQENGKGFNIVDTKDFEPRRVDLEGIRPFVAYDIKEREDVDSIEPPSGDQKPVLYVTVEAEPDRYHSIYKTLQGEFGEKVLHMEVRRKLKRKDGKEEEKAPATVDIAELIQAAMGERSTGDKDFACEMFRSLSTGDLETAMKKAGDFYRGDTG
jgi:DNA repair exonuclease SbcCD nuclease subunit